MARNLRTERRPWSQTPSGAIALERTGAIAEPTAVALPRPGGALCLAGRGFVEPFAKFSSSGLKVSPGAAGLGVDGSALTTAACRLHATARTTSVALKNAWDSPTGPVTFLAVVERLGTNGNGASPIFANGSASTAPYSAYGISLSTANVLSVSCSAGGTLRTLTLDTLAANAITVIVGRYDGARLEGFVNGVKSASSVACTGNLGYPGASASPAGPAIGNYYQYTDTARSFAGRVYLAALWAEALSDAQIAALSANPWQIFRPLRRVSYFDLAGGGELNVTTSLGQAQATGLQVEVNRKLEVSIPLAAGTAQGFVAGINRQLGIQASVGQAVAQGLSAIIETFGQLVVNAELGDAQAQGLLAGINLKKEVAALLGTANASCLSATISSESILHINATVGQAAALGHLANINRQLEVQVGVAQAIAQGFQASVVNASTTFTDAEMEEIARRLLSSGPWLVKLKVILENL